MSGSLHTNMSDVCSSTIAVLEWTRFGLGWFSIDTHNHGIIYIL